MALLASRIASSLRSASIGATVEYLSAAVWPSQLSRSEQAPATRRHYRAGFVDDDGDVAPRFLVTGAGGQIGTELLHLLRCVLGQC